MSPDPPAMFTPAEAADVVTAVIDRFRDPLRREASNTDAFHHPRLRAELVAQIDLLINVDEAVRAALQAPSRVGPERPALRDVPEIVSPGNRSAAQIAASWKAGDDR